MSLSAFQLVSRESSSNDLQPVAGQNQLCIVVGLGMLGTALSQQFSLAGLPVQAYQGTGFEWDETERLTGLLGAIVNNSDSPQIEIVWSAGKGRFTATSEEMNRESDYFQEVVEFLVSCNNKTICVNYLSSAGGIYENSGWVQDVDGVSPSRPYAEAKLKQENMLNDSGLRTRVYRISSAYGPFSRSPGSGLINTLISNSVSGLNTTIFGGLNTMRDYIYSMDVARSIVDDIQENRNSGTRILATGRAVSVNMLVNLVSKIIGKRAKATYVTNHENHKDIMFSPSVISASSIRTSLEEGMLIVSSSYAKCGHPPVSLNNL